jgi:hypothetical protein
VRSLDVSIPYGPPRPVTGIALPPFVNSRENIKHRTAQACDSCLREKICRLEPRCLTTAALQLLVVSVLHITSTMRGPVIRKLRVNKREALQNSKRRIKTHPRQPGRLIGGYQNLSGNLPMDVRVKSRLLLHIFCPT